jgi:monoamine oxidase
MNWGKMPFAKGSYSCPGPGDLTSFLGAHSDPQCSGKIIFAGEHVSLNDPGFMNGAVESGEVAARQVVGSGSETQDSAVRARASEFNV